MPSPIDDRGAARERALKQAGEVMLMIEAAIRRADQALEHLDAEVAPDAQVRAGLVRARRDLEGVRRRVHQEVYLHSDSFPYE